MSPPWDHGVGTSSGHEKASEGKEGDGRPAA